MDLFNQVSHGTTLLTPNSRLSAVLIQQYSAWQQLQKKLCWPSLDCLPQNSFIARLWNAYVIQQPNAQPLLLTPEQEQIAWEDILRHSPENEYLLQLSSAAELAKSAWHTLKLWRVHAENPHLKTTEDAQIFQTWAAAFEKKCAQSLWLDSSSMIELLITQIEKNSLAIPKKIILLGFTEISPLHQALLERCQHQGCEVIYNTITKKQRDIARIALNDADSEMRTMARWAKAILEEQPEARIGCVVPRLEDVREQVIQHFSAVFCEENTFTLNHTTLPFNISAGKNLASYPVIHAAIHLLKLSTATIPAEVLSSILHSPFIGDAEYEMLNRARYETLLRRDNITSMSLQQLLENKLTIKNHCPRLAERMRTVLDSFHLRHEKKFASGWTHYFIEQLNAWGWPGERSVDSHEYQAIQAWLKVMAEYTTLDGILTQISYQQALYYLIYLTAQKVFQVESPAAPIQILGMLEAAEIPFDYLWVMGLDDSAWPQSPNPNPFIPQRLQKKLKMPHANAERELQYGIQLTQQLQSCADVIIFSHALKSDDAELRPSPIISDVKAITLNDLRLADFNPITHSIFASQKIEFLNDETAPAIGCDEVVRGGTSIFKLQAACPFKAFAELRLHARKVEPPALGLRAMDKGEILHRAMEMLWGVLKDQTYLLQMPQDTLDKLVEDCVDQAIHHIAESTANNRRYLGLESQRLQRLIHQWLDREKARPPFKVIKIEEERKLTIANLAITLRVDRIDELDSGRQIIIDYKTGKTHPNKDWFGDRPNEPQLPLYCTTDSLKTCGILFAQINSEEMKWKGISGIDLGIPAVKTVTEERNTDASSWQNQIENWQTILEKLATDFAQGKANIDPKEDPQTCEHCHLKPICRIHETITENILSYD